MKTAQSTPKIHRNLDFSSDLVHFLAEVGRALAKLGGLKPSQLNTFLHPCVAENSRRISFFPSHCTVQHFSSTVPLPSFLMRVVRSAAPPARRLPARW